MHALDWLLTALQSEDEAVASHALLLLWKRVTQDDAQGLTTTACVEMGPRPWRRLGLLLFADDPLTVQAVVSIVAALTMPEGEERQSQAQRRVWQSDWRQFVIDKLTDCHSRASIAPSIPSQAKSTGNHDREVATRLLLILQASFMDALKMAEATAKDQARMIDLLVELAASPLDGIACMSLEFLSMLLHHMNTTNEPSTQALDPNVAAYLEASRVFVDSLHWLRDSDLLNSYQAQQPNRSKIPPQQKRLLTRRCQRTLALLVVGSQQSPQVASALVRDPDLLLETCLGIIEGTRLASVDTDGLHGAAIELLASVLSRDCLQTTEVVSQLRLNGGLITLSWLQSHRSSVVREAVDRIFTSVIRASPASDLLRALVEQGCVVVSYLHLNEDSRGCAILEWVIKKLESSGSQLTQTIAQSVIRSTNHKLQRNIILSLLLLSQSSEVVHEALFDSENHNEKALFDGIVRAAVHANEDASLATSLLAIVAIFADKRSTLRLDGATKATLRNTASSRDLIADSVAPSSRIVELVCADSVVITADATLLVQQCKVVQRQFESLACAALSNASSDFVVVDLREFDVATVQLFVRLLSLTTQQLASALHPYNQSHVQDLLTLAHRLENAKCWHAATLATSHALQHGAIHWKQVLDLAVSRRHPALMLRAVRAALNETSKPTSVDTRPKEIHDAALTLWQELLAQRY